MGRVVVLLVRRRRRSELVNFFLQQKIDRLVTIDPPGISSAMLCQSPSSPSSDMERTVNRHSPFPLVVVLLSAPF